MVIVKQAYSNPIGETVIGTVFVGNNKAKDIKIRDNINMTLPNISITFSIP